MRRPNTRRSQRIGVGRSGYRIEMQFSRENGAGERRLKCGQVVHAYAGSATMRIEISAALAECVSAPTLMNSTPVSAYARMFSSTMPPEAYVGIQRFSC